MPALSPREAGRSGGRVRLASRKVLELRAKRQQELTTRAAFEEHRLVGGFALRLRANRLSVLRTALARGTPVARFARTGPFVAESPAGRLLRELLPLAPAPLANVPGPPPRSPPSACDRG